MKTWIKGQDQRPFFSCIVVLVGVVGTLCFGPSLAAQADPTEPQSAANVEIPFELYNGNVVVTKATIGKMKKMNVILDTGTNPSIVSKLGQGNLWVNSGLSAGSVLGKVKRAVAGTVGKVGIAERFPRRLHRRLFHGPCWDSVLGVD